MVSPFTQSPSASMVVKKELQTKEKSNPSGASKILNKAREKAAAKAKVFHTGSLSANSSAGPI